MLSGEGNENGEKPKVQLISKIATLHVMHTFFVHFFVAVLHLYDVKLPETSSLHVLCRKCRTCFCSLFLPLPLIFTLVAASIFHFLATAAKFSCCSSNKKCVLFFFSRSSFLSPFLSSTFAGLSPIFSFSLSFSFSIF